MLKKSGKEKVGELEGCNVMEAKAGENSQGGER